MALQPAELEGLATDLREVARRAWGAPVELRRQAVALLVRDRMGAASAGDRAALLYRLRDAFVPGPERVGPAPQGPAVTASEAAAGEAALLERLSGLVQGEGGAGDVEVLLAELAERVRAAVPQEVQAGGLAAGVDHLIRSSRSLEPALKQGAQEFVDRLMEAFDPNAVVANGGKRAFGFGGRQKAAVYDALVEKFSRLDAYHRRGRLVRDFRSICHRHLKERMRSEEES